MLLYPITWALGWIIVDLATLCCRLHWLVSSPEAPPTCPGKREAADGLGEATPLVLTTIYCPGRLVILLTQPKLGQEFQLRLTVASAHLKLPKLREKAGVVISSTISHFKLSSYR